MNDNQDNPPPPINFKKGGPGGPSGGSAQIRRILVVTSLSANDTAAISRGDQIARRFRAELHIIHILPKPGVATTTTNPCVLSAHPAVLREVIVRWARTEASTELSHENVHIEVASSLSATSHHIEEVAKRIGADLVVLDPDANAWREIGLAPFLASSRSRSRSRSILLASAPRRDGDIVAVTDLETPGYPVIETALRYAAAFRRRVTLFHNVGLARNNTSKATSDAAATNGDDPRDPRDPLEQFSGHLRDLERITESFPSVRIVNLARARSTAKAIEEIAVVSNADLIIIGVRPGRGRTLIDYLERKQNTHTRSVLAIPIQDAALA